MADRTLALIKPNAVSQGHIGDIVGRYEREGLRILGLKMMQLGPQDARKFYAEHEGKPFFEGLVAFMTSGPICALVIGGENAIQRNREIMGATDPAKAAPGTLRALFGAGVTQNAVHGSDSPGSADREIRFFFAESSLVG